MEEPATIGDAGSGIIGEAPDDKLSSADRAELSHFMKIRGVAERLSRGMVFKRRLPEQFGRLPIYVTPEAGLRYWLSMSRVDAVLYRMAEELVKPGCCVWDVGANVGLFSFCAAALSGRNGFVLAIEPDCWLASLIARSAQELKQENASASEVRVLCASVSDSVRISTLAISKRARASNHLAEAAGSSQASACRYELPTTTVTLDFLLDYFPHPSVLKIDVETHEAKVLEGARRLLQEVRPAIWCEVSPENSAEVTGLLHDARYDLYGAQSQPHPKTSCAWYHTLAVPNPLERAA